MNAVLLTFYSSKNPGEKSHSSNEIKFKDEDKTK